ncbi:uncharacterized protein METZ01_LOCUS114016, partial [marine metagenome]
MRSILLFYELNQKLTKWQIEVSRNNDTSV